MEVNVVVGERGSVADQGRRCHKLDQTKGSGLASTPDAQLLATLTGLGLLSCSALVLWNAFLQCISSRTVRVRDLADDRVVANTTASLLEEIEPKIDEPSP